MTTEEALQPIATSHLCFGIEIMINNQVIRLAQKQVALHPPSIAHTKIVPCVQYGGLVSVRHQVTALAALAQEQRRHWISPRGHGVDVIRELVYRTGD